MITRSKSTRKQQSLSGDSLPSPSRKRPKTLNEKNVQVVKTLEEKTSKVPNAVAEYRRICEDFEEKLLKVESLEKKKTEIKVLLRVLERLLFPDQEPDPDDTISNLLFKSS